MSSLRPARIVFAVHATIAALVFSPAQVGLAEPSPCPHEEMFSVDSPRPALTDKLCDMVGDIREKLVACGLVQEEAIGIEIVAREDHSLGACLAQFDCRKNLIRITDPDSFSRELNEDDPYTGLSSDAVLRALLTHEMAHALLFQSTSGYEIALVDHEYVAAAMELDFLDAASRDLLLLASPISLPPDPALLSAFVYAAAPRKFAVIAWQHFNLPGNGCSLISRIVSREFSFKKGE